MIEIERPKIICEEDENGAYAKFTVEPLEKGFGVTLGNALRRTLLAALPGAAVVGKLVLSVKRHSCRSQAAAGDTALFH